VHITHRTVPFGATVTYRTNESELGDKPYSCDGTDPIGVEGATTSFEADLEKLEKRIETVAEGTDEAMKLAKQKKQLEDIIASLKELARVNCFA